MSERLRERFRDLLPAEVVETIDERSIFDLLDRTSPNFPREMYFQKFGDQAPYKAADSLEVLLLANRYRARGMTGERATNAACRETLQRIKARQGPVARQPRKRGHRADKGASG